MGAKHRPSLQKTYSVLISSKIVEQPKQAPAYVSLVRKGPDDHGFAQTRQRVVNAAF